MRYFHGLPDEEIAASLGCRPGTVRSLVSRALVDMRAEDGGRPDPDERRERAR
jgi:DNA-directed RNA polymerase specialized sigma24 family protein